jgi:hypothetical protein
MSVLRRNDVIEGPNRTLLVNDHRIDTVGWLDPETMIVVQGPVAATPEQQREVEIRGWQRALASVEHRLVSGDQLGGPASGAVGPPNCLEGRLPRGGGASE